MDRELRDINPNLFVDLTMFGWLPICFAIFLIWRSHKAVVIAFLFAWLFLPVAKYRIQGLPDYTKVSATCLGVAAAVVVLDSARLRKLRFQWVDVFVLMYTAMPVLSSLKNGLGLWDGLSGTFEAITVFAVPWYLGRLYFDDPKTLRYLAIGIVVGALLYMPLCIWERQMSPHLHRTLYGYHLIGFKHASRGGSWRPMVFMQHGLMVGFYFACATIVAYWLFLTKSVKRLLGLPFGLVPPLLALTTVAIQSSLALLLMLVGVGCMTSVYLLRFRLPATGLILVFPIYVTVRHFLNWDGAELIELGRTLFSERRAISLEYRFDNENLLVERAKLANWFGWGGQGRFLQNDEREDFLTVDGLWLVAWGRKGLFGLIGLVGTILVGPILSVVRLKTAHWRRTDLAPISAFAVPISLYMIDCILNAFENPLYVIAAGGVSGILATRSSTRNAIAGAAA